MLLATVATLVLYLAASMALLALVRGTRAVNVGLIAAALFGAIYSLWTFYGAGLEATGWGAVLLATGIPIYFLMRSRAGSSLAAVES